MENHIYGSKQKNAKTTIKMIFNLSIHLNMIKLALKTTFSRKTHKFLIHGSFKSLVFCREKSMLERKMEESKTTERTGRIENACNILLTFI